MSDVITKKKRRKPSPLRWMLAAVTLIAAGYLVYRVGGVTGELNQPTPISASERMSRRGQGPICPVSADLGLSGTVDVRLKMQRGDAIHVAKRFRATVDSAGLHMPNVGTPGLGSVTLDDGRYATFQYAPDACTELLLAPPTDDDIAPPDSGDAP